MTSDERQQAINELKKICVDIGCSGLDPDMCRNRPHRCGIIRKVVMGSKGSEAQGRT